MFSINASKMDTVQEVTEFGDNVKKFVRSQNVVPVVVKQILNQQEQTFTLFGVICQILKLVVRVLDIKTESTTVTYKIEDHTGAIRAIWWLEGDNDCPGLPDIVAGNYVILYGCYRVYGIEKTLTILNANVTTDSNDITTHLLDVIRVKFEAEAKSKEVPPLENNPCVPLAHSMSLVVGEYDREYEQPMLTKMQTNICNILKDFEATPIGISYEQLLRQFQPHQHYEIKRALQFLINEGYAYSTIDNCHFKLTCVM